MLFLLGNLLKKGEENIFKPITLTFTSSHNINEIPNLLTVGAKSNELMLGKQEVVG